ncbi:MAG: hypothetical protein ACRYGG_21010 [Janthinobacterium lividum]
MAVDIAFSQFFDRAAVQAKVKDGTRSALSKAGAFVRTRAKTSIRKRKASSEPGSPPSSHTGLLRDRIFFGYDSARESVVVGPQLLNGNRGLPVPELLEQGGDVKRGKVQMHYAAHPFMRPALEAERDHFVEVFGNCIKGN